MKQILWLYDEMMKPVQNPYVMYIYSEYGFAEKVVEGMSVRINSITIKVQARAFHASFELWQLQGNSLNPKWQRSDLRNTRVTDPKRGEVSHIMPSDTMFYHRRYMLK